jgi:hypothetical protein
MIPAIAPCGIFVASHTCALSPLKKSDMHEKILSSVEQILSFYLSENLVCTHVG